VRSSACINAVALVAALCAPGRLLSAQSTGAVLPTAAAVPRTYAGNCPTSVEFVGHILVTVPGTRVDYQWERSNGTIGKVLHAQIGKPPAPGSPPDTAKQANVTDLVKSDKWYVGLPSEGGQFWEKLHILSPFDIRSAAAPVDVACRD
jgi:hypothetical protein